MSLHKLCADHLRSQFDGLAGGKLRSGHAHELVAAFFGYKTAAALRAEVKYPVSALGNAKFLVPDLERMKERLGSLAGLPAGLPNVGVLAATITDFLLDDGHFAGEVWNGTSLDDDVNEYVQKNASLVEDALNGEMASTNAYFDELYVDEYAYQAGIDDWVVTLTGSLNGENDQDKTFVGDKIAFTTLITFKRVAGRTAYDDPTFETDGEVDMDGYYDD